MSFDEEGLITIADDYQPLLSDAYVGGHDVQVYALSDNMTGVFALPTFDISGGDACYAHFILDAYEGLHNLTRRGIIRLLIDTSNTGGGYIRLTQDLQRIFTYPSFNKYSNFDTLLAKAPFSQAIVHRYLNSPQLTWGGSYEPDGYRRWLTLDDLDREDNIFEPGRTFPTDGHTLDTANDISDIVDEVLFFEKWLNPTDTPVFAPEQIKFTGNGLCGSACASFINFLIEYFNGPAIITSAEPGRPIEFQAFAAAQVYDSYSIREEAEYVGIDFGQYIPVRQKYAGFVSIPFRGGLSPDVAPGRCLRYRSFHAQHAFTQTVDEWQSPLAGWEAAAKQW